MPINNHNITLAINTGFAVNRFPEPEEWTQIIGQQLGIKKIQFTADLLNPYLPENIINKYINRINKSCEKNNTAISSTFTGAFTRLNHLAHPNEEIRKYWIGWFKRFVGISVAIGAQSMGSHFGILTKRDNNNPDLRKERVSQNIQAWHEIAEYANNRGLLYLTWEPMSISREQGETIEKTKKLQSLVNDGSPLPFKLCLDVDHGDITSSNPDDINPYSWLTAFAKDTPLVHIKQSSSNKQGHWPFTAEYNQKGIIHPEKIINTLITSGAKNTELILELSFREREPADSQVINVLKESVSYWKKYLICEQI